uniref:Uncharacterized protein n=1 Tax=Tetraselmis chuii TaxID=63592 RepID=A0A7S1X1R2_9CHLO|mmetsp:Transcript_19989/g.35641  ORF Transcript_19989/g.35641 Transcript_19989/m.35641 type:complete len:141 (+) Transcript_19989:337-759(+)|eukprot:CAMPEP_0177758380 /NCGR_PEP_ID=MMETSP0491_2-20121128/4152_1 /TAXON_ID=63592 /ORGANISM="Tetraselmis chuii, Strain PLY429" /LENGTH=140 /DNA_ID=CAMNT_0019274107 /DNA_START=328 /DNA_END=750 /DNA_ORIENTATION=+
MEERGSSGAAGTASGLFEAAEALRRAGDEAVAAADYCESQFVRHSDKVGVTNNSKASALRCFESVAAAVAGLSAEFSAAVEAEAARVGKLETRSATVFQRARMEKLSSSFAAAQESSVTLHSATRGPMSFKLQPPHQASS